MKIPKTRKTNLLGDNSSRRISPSTNPNSGATWKPFVVFMPKISHLLFTLNDGFTYDGIEMGLT